MANSDATLRISVPNHGIAARLELNDVDISAQVTGVTLSMAATEINQATITYACDVIEVDGVFQIIHRCPVTPDG